MKGSKLKELKLPESVTVNTITELINKKINSKYLYLLVYYEGTDKYVIMKVNDDIYEVIDLQKEIDDEYLSYNITTKDLIYLERNEKINNLLNKIYE